MCDLLKGKGTKGLNLILLRRFYFTQPLAMLVNINARMLEYRDWFGQHIIHFLKYQKARRKKNQKTCGRVEFYAADCFTSYFVSCFQTFQEMENTQPHEISRVCVLSCTAPSLGSWHNVWLFFHCCQYWFCKITKNRKSEVACFL